MEAWCWALLPGGEGGRQGLARAVAVVGETLQVAVILKRMRSSKIGWGVVWVSAAVTAALAALQPAAPVGPGVAAVTGSYACVPTHTAPGACAGRLGTTAHCFRAGGLLACGGAPGGLPPLGWYGLPFGRCGRRVGRAARLRAAAA